MAAWLAASIEAVIDATHPYAAQISCNAVNPPCGGLYSARQPAMRPACNLTGDKWLTVASAEAAPMRSGRSHAGFFLFFFLSLGRLELGAFAASPHPPYISRTIEPPEVSTLPRIYLAIRDRGPFATS